MTSVNIRSMSLEISNDPAPLVTDGDGVVRVGVTRVRLDTVVYAFNQGALPTFTQRSATICSTEVPLTPICNSDSSNMIMFGNSTNLGPILPAFANAS